MKTPSQNFVQRLLVGAFTVGWAAAASAVPYATLLSNSGGSVSFLLNEPANSVKILSDTGSLLADLGALPKGPFATNLTISGTFKVEVKNSTTNGWVQTSSDTNINNKFWLPGGIAVNTNPQSTNFGRIYVANGREGTTSGAIARDMTDGIFVLNPDHSDAFGQGNTALTAGIPFTKAGAGNFSPARVSIGEDDKIYITDWSDASGNLYVTDSTFTSFEYALKPLTNTAVYPVGIDNTHGSIAGAVVTGTLADGNLRIYTVDEDYQTDPTTLEETEENSAWRYDVGSGPLPFTSAPTLKLATPAVFDASTTMDLVKHPSLPILYMIQRRAVTNQASVYVVDTEGSGIVQDSLTISRELAGNPVASDLLIDTVAATVSPDGKFLAALRFNGMVSVIPLLPDGTLDLGARSSFAIFPAATATAIAYDAAGNLYAGNRSSELLRAFSPGGITTATTGSEGTFTITTPPSVTVVASGTASENGPVSADFTLTRSGTIASPLTVTYTMSGTATNGVDYPALSGTATFGIGESAVVITVTPTDDSTAEAIETVILTITPPPDDSYSASLPNSATIQILDNDQAGVTIATLQTTAYERTVGDYVSYVITRIGDSSIDLNVNLDYSGGVNGVDFNGPTSAFIPFGQLSVTNQVTVVDNTELNGDRALVCTILPDGSYVIGTPGSATATISDDELATETNVVFYADFDTDVSSEWTIAATGANGIVDSIAQFGYDYSADFVPASPSGSTVGLKLMANKFDAEMSAAAVNVYPTGESFSGNYIVRFNMYIAVGTGTSTTEATLFGVNHSGNKTNWFRASTTAAVNPPLGGDGVWFATYTDASRLGDYVIYAPVNQAAAPASLTNRLADDFENIFKTPPFYLGSGGGSPSQVFAGATGNWVDVEIKQLNGILTYSINKSVIFTYTNTTAYTSGNIMLGYVDPYDSIETSLTSAVYYDNVRVIQLDSPVPTTPSITAIRVVGGNVEIDFTGGTADLPTAFSVVGAATVNSAFTSVSATVTSTGAGAFRATFPVSGATGFYRIAR